MTHSLKTHIEKIIVPTIVGGTPEHGSAMVLALVAHAFRAGCQYYSNFQGTPDDLNEYINDGWKRDETARR